MTLCKEQIEQLRKAAEIVGEHGAYSSKTVILLCDELLWAWRQLEAARVLAALNEGKDHAVC